MSAPGDEIRRTRTARGLSQAKLAEMAGVSLKTIGRIESGEEYRDPRSIPAVQRALGIGEFADVNDPPLSKASASQFGGELTRRLMEAERILEHARITPGRAPADGLTRDGLILGPDVVPEQRSATDG